MVYEEEADFSKTCTLESVTVILKPLAKVVGETAADVAVKGYHEIFPGEAVVGKSRYGVMLRMIVDSEVDTSAEFQVVEGDQRFLLSEGLKP